VTQGNLVKVLYEGEVFIGKALKKQAGEILFVFGKAICNW